LPPTLNFVWCLSLSSNTISGTIDWSNKAGIYHYFLEYNYCCMIENSELPTNS
jgi:hypothetical protein